MGATVPGTEVGAGLSPRGTQISCKGWRGGCGLRVNFMPVDLHFSEQYWWMDEIIGMRAGGPPWPLSLKM